MEVALEKLPARYRRPRFMTWDEVMPHEWLGEVGEWMNHARGRFRQGGDGQGRFGWELVNVADDLPAIADLKGAVLDRMDDALLKTEVAPFEVAEVEAHATLYHHGGRFESHVDVGEGVESRRLAFALYLHTSPRMFSGGELEFPDGTTVEPRNNRLVIYDPTQRHAIRRVECWSADFLHGRWAVSGWLHD